MSELASGFFKVVIAGVLIAVAIMFLVTVYNAFTNPAQIWISSALAITLIMVGIVFAFVWVILSKIYERL
jgi:hypothetical protein